MTLSVPGVLVSRDGSVREYMGHSKPTGTLLGRVEKLPRQQWNAVCEGCFEMRVAKTQRSVVLWLRDHWRHADASMAASHVWKTR